ncbi:MAG: ParB/RepB/Spo0J family partition protein [Candidatus Microbacterium stercoravium]
MATKRTGLGRGIGALIPTGTESKGRPSDVFFVGAGLPESAAQVTEEKPAESAPKKTAPKKAAATKEAASPATTTGRKTPAKAAAKTSEKAPAKRAATRKPVPKPETRATAPVRDAAPEADVESAPSEQLADVPGIRLVEIDPHKIVPNPRQPRTLFDADDLAELVHSVREFGVLQPVVVRDKKDGTYELIMGERRTRASREAGLESIPAIVRETADENLLRDALLENIHRAELNPLEEASAYQQLINDFGITQDQLADRIGRSRPQISNTIRLLRLPEAVQQRVAAGVLTAGHARAILSLDGDAEAMQRLADKVVDEELSVRGAEAAAKRVLEAGERTTPTVKPKQGARRAYLDEVSEKLGDRLNTKVKIDLTARRGSLKISFATIQDLNRILGELGETGYEQ